MKFVVTKENRLCTVFAKVGRDGTVVWHPQRNHASELEQERAEEIVQRFPQAKVVKVVCRDCGGDCESILQALKTELGVA